MCGRYKLELSLTELERQLAAASAVPADMSLLPRYNAAPLQFMPVLRLSESAARVISPLRWGLLPAWAKDETLAAKMINARSETLAERPAFRKAFAARRCLIPADGWYEWKKAGSRKEPHCFELEHGGLFCFAGLWESWRSPGGDGEALETFTIITRGASDIAQQYHERMPLLFNTEKVWQKWLNPAATPVELSSLLSAEPATQLRVFPVDAAVGNVRNDYRDLLKAPRQSAGLLDGDFFA